MKPRSNIFLIVLVPACFGLGGCGILDEPIKHLVLGDAAPPDPKTRPKPMHYPADAEVADPLPIEVIREKKHFRFENRSIRTYKNVEIWLNREYGATVKHVPIGRSEPIPLSRFVNQHGERYPTGTFLRPKSNRVLVLVDVVINGKIHKTTTQLVKDWDRP